MKPLSGADAWWPKSLGSPSSTGSQNDSHYAYFADANRLAIKAGGEVKVYDTGGKRIDGFGQQQGSGSSLSFSTGSGTVDVSQLSVVEPSSL